MAAGLAGIAGGERHLTEAVEHIGFTGPVAYPAEKGQGLPQMAGSANDGGGVADGGTRGRR